MKYLKDDGFFIFDCYNPHIDYIISSEKVKTKVAEYEAIGGRKVKIEQPLNYEYQIQFNRIKWHYFMNNKFNLIQNKDMRLYLSQEIDSFLSLNRFEVVKKFGNFNKEQFSDKSEKQFLICKKSI